MEHLLRLKTLGQFECQRDGKIWQSFESDKTRALLVYLALESGLAHTPRARHADPVSRVRVRFPA